MMQVKPYKPQNNNSITKTSDREKKNYTLDVYNEAAGIKPKKNVLEPYSKLVPNAQTTLNQPAQTNSPGTVQPFKAPKTTVNSVPSTMPGTPAYKVDTNDMTIQEQAAKDSQEAGWTVPNLSAPKNKPSLSGGTTFGSDPSTLPKPENVRGGLGNRAATLGSTGTIGTGGLGTGTGLGNRDATSVPTPPGSGTLADYTPAFKAATARPQAVEPAGFPLYMDMVNNTRKMQGLAPVSGGTQTMSAESGETKPNVLDPYSEMYQKELDEANALYDGDFYGYDSSGLYGHDLELYNEIRDRLNSMEISRDQYLAQQREAERQKNIDLQNAFIGSEMTKKYLPLYLKENGMGGLGVSQSTLAQVQNDYDNLVSGINSETSATTRELLQRYLDEYKKSKAEMQSNISSIQAAKKQEEIEENLEYADYMFGQYDPNKSITVEQLGDLRALFDENREYLSPEQKTIYEKLLNDWQSKIYSESYINMEMLLRNFLQSTQAMLSPGMRGRPYNSVKSQADIDRIYQNAASQLMEAFEQGKISEDQYNELLKRYVEPLSKLKY